MRPPYGLLLLTAPTPKDRPSYIRVVHNVLTYVCVYGGDNDFHLPILSVRICSDTQNCVLSPRRRCRWILYMCFRLCGFCLYICILKSIKEKAESYVVRASPTDWLPHIIYISVPCEPGRRKHLYKLSKYERPFVSLCVLWAPLYALMRIYICPLNRRHIH